MAGEQIGNAEVRRILGNDPMGEPRERTQELYNFFSKTSHPNHEQLSHRFLGDGNEFVLGAVGRPSLTLLADYAIKTLNLWFWFSAKKVKMSAKKSQRSLESQTNKGDVGCSLDFLNRRSSRDIL